MIFLTKLNGKVIFEKDECEKCKWKTKSFSQELFYNALTDITILQSVRVAIEDEGLTISSPGGFIEGVNLKNLLSVEPHGRNQVLADALKRIGEDFLFKSSQK